jgi:beta-glucosidase-like glycosyl hydrolase
LLSKMTVEEKINNLQTTHSPEYPAYVTRLSLPPYSVAECLHGYCGWHNVTVFPQSITLAATWNESMLHAVGNVIGTEARGVYNQFQATKQLPNHTLQPPGLACFSPQINIARDPRCHILYVSYLPLCAHLSLFYCSRWGRAQETYGECPFLTGTLARNMVNGMQGSHPTYVQVAASPKHFDAYGGATTRGHRSPTEVTVSFRDWVETFLPQFRAALVDDKAKGTRGALSTMCSYNTLCLTDREYTKSCPGPSHGVPACADPTLMGQGLKHETNEEMREMRTLRERDGSGSGEGVEGGMLRGVWDWSGYVVGDAGAIKFVQTDHEWAFSQPQAAADALKGGADLALGGGYNKDVGALSFAALLNASRMAPPLVSTADIDRALARIVHVRIKLGQLDDVAGVKGAAAQSLNPYNTLSIEGVNSAAHRELARNAAREGVVLLTNKNTSSSSNRARRIQAESRVAEAPTLPLDAKQLANLGAGAVLVVGPNAKLVAIGNYASGTDLNVTAFMGLDAVLPTPLTAYAQGCEVASANTSGFANAISLARKAAVTIAVMGIDGTQEHETGTRVNISLPGVQNELLSLLREACDYEDEEGGQGDGQGRLGGGKGKLVVVLIGGSAMAVSWIKDHADALIYAGYGGEEAGTALADVIYEQQPSDGSAAMQNFNPGGRLPITFYSSITQLPTFPDYKMDRAPGRTYRYLQPAQTPLFRFGKIRR